MFQRLASQLMLYFESVLMSSGRFVCGVVSRTRTIAYVQM